MNIDYADQKVQETLAQNLSMENGKFLKTNLYFGV